MNLEIIRCFRFISPLFVLAIFLVIPQKSYAQQFNSTCPDRATLPFDERCGFFLQKNLQNQDIMSHRYVKAGSFLNDQWSKTLGGPFDASSSSLFDRDLWNKLKMNKNISTTSINLFELKRDNIDGQYYAAVTADQRIGSERFVAVFAKASADQAKFGYKQGQYLAMSKVIDWKQYLLSEQDSKNRSLTDYFKYLVEDMPSGGWAVQELQSSIPPGGCKDRAASYYYSQPPNNLGYFSSSFGPSNRLPYQIAISSNKNSKSAAITLPKPAPAEKDYSIIKDRRPEIVFSYRFYMPYRGSININNYYYFLPPPTSPHCNLAIRFSDSLGRGNLVDAYIVAIELSKVSQANDRSIFDPDNPIATVTITRDSIKEFIGALSGGKTPDDPGYSSDDKKILEGADELGGIRAGSGDSPTATGSDTTTTCTASFKGFWRRLLIGQAICGTLELLGSIAFFFANLAFSMLIYASGLQ